MSYVESYNEYAELQDWQNKVTENLNMRCNDQQGFYRVKSEHFNFHKDRRWQFFCRAVSDSSFEDAYWSGYVHEFDKPILFMCHPNYYVCGAKSDYKYFYGDRRWNFRCCRSENHFTKNCDLSEYVNDFDKPMEYSVIGAERVITGVFSYHNNFFE